MLGAFESTLPMRFYDDLNSARIVAERDSVIIGGVIFDVVSIRTEENHVVFLGYLPRRLVTSRFPEVSSTTDYFEGEMDHLEYFNTTWESITIPNAVIGVVGFIPRGDVSFVNPIPASGQREDDTVLFGLRVKRERRSLGIKTIGKRLCRNCGDEIPEKRLSAQPTARYCADCQSSIERRKGNV